MPRSAAAASPGEGTGAGAGMQPPGGQMRAGSLRRGFPRAQAEFRGHARGWHVRRTAKNDPDNRKGNTLPNMKAFAQG